MGIFITDRLNTEPSTVSGESGASQGYGLQILTGPKYGFIGDPNPYFLFGEKSASAIKHAVFVDDMFSTYPYFQMAVSDQSGEFAEKYPFIESLNLKLIFGNIPANQVIEHDFYWTQSQLTQAITTDHLSGVQMWEGVSKYRKDAGLRSRSFGIASALNSGVPMSAPSIGVIQQVIAPYNFTNTVIDKLIQNVDLFYQSNVSDFDFLQSLVKIASSPDKSPYFSFINLKGEFYFDNLLNLEGQQVKDILKFRMEQSVFQQIEPDQIKSYKVIFAGVPFTEKRYHVNSYYIDSMANFKLLDTTLTSSFKAPQQPDTTSIGNPRNRKMLIRGAYQGELRTIDYFGILDFPELQKKNYDGWTAYKNRDALLIYRMELTIPFNHEACAGRTIQIKFKESSDSEKYSKMYAGKWLIRRSEHHWDGFPSRVMFTKLEVVRSGLEIPTDQEPLLSLAKEFGNTASIG